LWYIFSLNSLKELPIYGVVAWLVLRNPYGFLYLDLTLEWSSYRRKSYYSGNMLDSVFG